MSAAHGTLTFLFLTCDSEQTRVRETRTSTSPRTTWTSPGEKSQNDDCCSHKGADDASSLRHVKSKTKNSEESDDSDVDNLDDEEVSLGSMDEEDFGDELEDEGGVFMDPDGDDDEGWVHVGVTQHKRLTSVSAANLISLVPELDEDDDEDGSVGGELKVLVLVCLV